MSFIDGFRIDCEHASLLKIAAPGEWIAQIDQNLKTIQDEFVKEDKEGYDGLVKRLRAWTWCHKVPSNHPDFASLERIAEIAQEIRQNAKTFITVGIGGSDLGGRTLHDLLNHPYHNELTASGQISSVPEIYFTGDTFDPFRLRGLLDVLRQRNLLDRTYINIVSKSGATAETALAGMILAEALGPDWMTRTVATTGLNSNSLLYQMQQNGQGEFMERFPVPEGVGGRFSFASPVGALILAVTAHGDPLQRLHEAYGGYQEAHDTFLNVPLAQNPAFKLARMLQIAEKGGGKTTLVFYPYFDNRKLGDWFLQLYAESVQERGEGLNVISTTGPTGNHSLLNGVINGPRDKVVLFLAPDDFQDDMKVPADAPLEGSLKDFQNLSFAEAQMASLKGTAQDFADKKVPNATFYFPKRDTASVFALMRILMDMVAVKGRLQSLHLDPITGQRRNSTEDTYIQTGVEGYKQRMRENIPKK